MSTLWGTYCYVAIIINMFYDSCLKFERVKFNG